MQTLGPLALIMQRLDKGAELQSGRRTAGSPPSLTSASAIGPGRGPTYSPCPFRAAAILTAEGLECTMGLACAMAHDDRAFTRIAANCDAGTDLHMRPEGHAAGIGEVTQGF